MFYKILLSVILLSFLLFFPASVLASDNFNTVYNITYTVSSSAVTHVLYDITLTNTTTQFYAPTYKADLGFSDVRNIEVLDEGDRVTPKADKTDKGVELNIDFVNNVVGLSKSHHFTISFDTSEVAQNSGSVWEINLPGIDSASSIDNYTMNLNLPQNLGKPSYIKPNIPKLSQLGGFISLSKEDLKDSGLSLAFGNVELYNFDLTYHLQNHSIVSETSEIALPLDTSYQKVIIDNISPKPINVYKDRDGNFLAQFRINPSQKIDVEVKGQAKVSLMPSRSSLNSEDRKIYTSQQKYWEVDDEKISKLGKELKTPRNIYNYVVSNLSYDFSRVNSSQERLGALSSLNNPNSAVCLEFTDLFVALARASGIPARAVNGFAYTQNTKERPLSLAEDVLHAWPEYYDDNRKEWVMVDPTWGNTTNGIDFFHTLDFDHLAFVIQGVNSSYPIPAGGYKNSSSLNSKDVLVSLTKDLEPTFTKLSVNPNFSDKYVSGVPVEGYVRVVNLGNSTSDKTNLIATSNFSQTVENSDVSQIPPFGFVDIPIRLDRTGFLTEAKGIIKIQLGQSLYYKSINIVPFFLSEKFYIGGVLIGIFSFGLLIYIARSRRLSSEG